MSKKNICASCQNFNVNKILKSSAKKKPEWLSKFDYVDNFIHKVKTFKQVSINKPDFNTFIQLKPSNSSRLVLYWAAIPKNYHKDYYFINNAKEAYHNFENYGISTINSEGQVNIKLNYPQNYCTIETGKKKPMVYYKHFHFVLSNQQHTQWEPQIYTKIIIPRFDYSHISQFLQHKCHILINALPPEYYGQDHIPNSFNLPLKLVKKMSSEDLKKWFYILIELHYQSTLRDIYLRILPTNIVGTSTLDLPIVVYCAHDKCNASDLVAEQLLKKGFTDISIYPGGMKEYRVHHPFD